MLMLPMALLQAAKEMWNMLTTNGQLQRHLTALQAYYLAGCGDMLTAFLQQVRFGSAARCTLLQTLALVRSVLPAMRCMDTAVLTSV